MPEDVSGVVLLVVFGFLVATVYGPWQWYCVDQARQELFEIRARIFNLAADGKIAFDSPEYQYIRDALNMILRFTHRVCWQQMLALKWAYPNLPSESELTRQVRSVQDRAVRDLLEREVHHVRRTMVRLIVYRSPALLMVMYGWRASNWLFSQSRDPRDEVVQSAGERIAVEAENVGPLFDRRVAA
jgi:hypothetical protein